MSGWPGMHTKLRMTTRAGVWMLSRSALHHHMTHIGHLACHDFHVGIQALYFCLPYWMPEGANADAHSMPNPVAVWTVLFASIL